MDYTRQLARFAVELQYSDLPTAVAEKAKEIALHSWGVQLAGSTLPWSKAVYRHVCKQGGVPVSTVANYGLKTSPINAAFVNGTFGHSFELDDNHAETGIKGGCAIVPAILALGEQQRSVGRDAITALVAGFEVMTRIGLAVTPALMRHGRQPTGSCGPFGSAIAAGKLLQFDETAMLHAISIAAAQGAGLLESPPAGRGDLKRVYGGMAASGGLRSALLVCEGLTGPVTMLEGALGFCRAFGDDSNLKALTSGLGTDWQILRAHYKIYAQDGYIQPMTEALDRLVKQHKFKPEDIKEIRAGCSKHAHEEIVGPIREPRDLTSSQFSANFSLALFLVKGGAGFDEYTESSLADPRIVELSRRIRTVVDDEIEREWQKTKPRGARVTVELTTGKTYSECVPMLRSLTADEVNEKFRKLAGVAVAPRQAEALLDIARNLEDFRDIANLAHLLRGYGSL